MNLSPAECYSDCDSVSGSSLKIVKLLIRTFIITSRLSFLISFYFEMFAFRHFAGNDICDINVI